MPGVHSMGTEMLILECNCIILLYRENKFYRENTFYTCLGSTSRARESLYKSAIASSCSSYRENTFCRENTWGPRQGLGHPYTTAKLNHPARRLTLSKLSCLLRGTSCIGFRVFGFRMHGLGYLGLGCKVLGIWN